MAAASPAMGSAAIQKTSWLRRKKATESISRKKRRFVVVYGELLGHCTPIARVGYRDLRANAAPCASARSFP
jgi:hypothetical protein